MLKCIHVLHVVGAEQCEDHDGAFHLLVWASIFADLWHFAIQPLPFAPFAFLLKCPHALYGFGVKFSAECSSAAHFVKWSCIEVALGVLHFGP